PEAPPGRRPLPRRALVVAREARAPVAHRRAPVRLHQALGEAATVARDVPAAPAPRFARAVERQEVAEKRRDADLHDPRRDELLVPRRERLLVLELFLV